MSIDARAVGIGAGFAMAVALPGVILGSALDIDAFALVILAGYVLGGTAAALKRPDSPYTHGVLAAAAAAVVTIVLLVAIRLAKDEDIRPAVYAFDLVVAGGCGSLGALIAQRRSA